MPYRGRRVKGINRGGTTGGGGAAGGGRCSIISNPRARDLCMRKEEAAERKATQEGQYQQGIASGLEQGRRSLRRGGGFSRRRRRY